MDLQEGGLSYEDARRQRLEENKKRMQDLGLADLSKSLSNGVAASKTPLHPRQVKPRMPRETVFVELRRSSRVASNPAPDYREVEVDSSLGRRSYSSRASSLLMRKYASDEARLEAALKAETIMKELPKSSPSFVKPMLQSHVTGGFWLGLPSSFCKTYLPKKDDRVVLENEKGEEWDTVFLANKAGLSGGWRGFSLDHGLVDGDALVFELVEPCRFKVHIVRASEPDTQTDEDINEQTNEESEKATTKKRQVLVKDNVEEEVETGLSKKGKGKRKQAIPESESGSEDGEERSGGRGGAKKNPSRKKRKGKSDDIEYLFEIKDEKEDIREVKDAKPLTSFLRVQKSNSSRASKKAMTSCGDGIEVC